ncbi:MAG: MurR/RpiR family transcriptional regulator [Protaetiibacter sp.]
MNAHPGDPPIGGTVSRIRSLVPALVPSEQRVAIACVEHPDVVALLSVADLAARTGTSSATVIRACQNLGFRGFQHLRLLLLRDLGAAERRPALTPGDSSADRVRAQFDHTARELSDALGALDFASFDAAAAAIAGARRVLAVGNGGSAAAAQQAAIRLLVTGRSCEAPADAVTQQMTARTLTSADVCLAVSDSGMNAVTLRAVEAADAAGAVVVGITSYARSRLAELSAHALVAGAAFHSWDDGVSGNLTQLLLVSSLQLEVARLSGAPAEHAGAEVLDEVLNLVDDARHEL